MNVKKPTDYSGLFAALDTLMAANLPQMELYCEIGRLVSGRPEKGAAVAAAEYLHSAYPDLPGFSPPEPAADAGFLPGLCRNSGGAG